MTDDTTTVAADAPVTSATPPFTMPTKADIETLMKNLNTVYIVARTAKLTYDEHAQVQDAAQSIGKFLNSFPI